LKEIGHIGLFSAPKYFTNNDKMVVKLYPPYRNFSLPRPWICLLGSLIIQSKPETQLYISSYPIVLPIYPPPIMFLKTF